MERAYYLIPDDTVLPIKKRRGYKLYRLSDLMRGSCFLLNSISLTKGGRLMPLHPFWNLDLILSVIAPAQGDPIHVVTIPPVRLYESLYRNALLNTTYDDVLLKYTYRKGSIIKIEWCSLYKYGDVVFSLL